MKKWILAYVPFILIVIIFSSFLVYEYLGSADLNDGQSDTTYYRSGYPPHQHPNGICPYDNEDESESSSLLAYVTERGYPGTIVRVGLVCILVCSVIIAFRAGNSRRAELISQLEDAVAKKDRTISDLEARNNELSQALNEKSSQCTSLEIAVEDLKSQKVVLNNHLMALREKHVECALSPEEIAKLAGVPEGVTFDEELLPHYYCNEIVENNLHVYVSNKGKCYHREYGCSGAKTPIHLFTAASQFVPCQKCIPYRGRFYKIPAWYYRYIQFATESDISSTVRHKMDGLD